MERIKCHYRWPGLSDMRMSIGFLYSSTEVSETLLDSRGNIGRVMTECFALYWVQAVVRYLGRSRYIVFGGLGMFCLYLPIVHLFVLFCLSLARMENAICRSDHYLVLRCVGVSFDFGLNWFFSLSWLGSKRWVLSLVRDAERYGWETNSLLAMLCCLWVPLFR